MDIQPEVASKRADYGKEKYENVEFQRTVAAAFKRLFAPNWCILDATASPDSLFASIKEKTLTTLSEVQHTPLQFLP